MKTLKEMDLASEETQLRLVMKLRDAKDPNHQRALDRLHLMLAKKTLEYYCEDGYDAFFERHRYEYSTDDGYRVNVKGHDISVSLETQDGIITGCGSTWDYVENDLRLSPKPSCMEKRAYTVIKRRMEEIQDTERVLYPFHPLHRLGNGYFDTKICMYNAHKLIKEQNQKEE